MLFRKRKASYAVNVADLNHPFFQKLLKTFGVCYFEYDGAANDYLFYRGEAPKLPTWFGPNEPFLEVKCTSPTTFIFDDKEYSEAEFVRVMDLLAFR